MRIALELFPHEGDRLQGRVLTEDGGVSSTFSGTLDLLRVIEDLRLANQDAARRNAPRGPVTDQQP